MLVLSRNAGEVIHIGDDIKVTVIEVRGNVVRIGITAPRDISVRRAELLQRINKLPEVFDGCGQGVSKATGTEPNSSNSEEDVRLGTEAKT